MKGLQFGRIMQMLDAMSHNKLQNYIVPGVSSSLIGDGGTKFGKVRVFRASREARDFVTPHSHRFDFCALVLAGRAHNTIYSAPDREQGDQWCTSTIKQVCGPDGIVKELSHLRDTTPTWWVQHTETYSPGDSYYMDFHEIHSIVFEKGTEVLFLEGPELVKQSRMLEPWVEGKCVPTFKTEPWMFEREV